MASGHMSEHALYSLYRIFIEILKFVFFIEMLNFKSQLLLRSSLVMTAGNYNNNLIIIIIPIVAPAGISPRGEIPRRHPSSSRVY